MISFKYNDVPITMDEETGKFSIENRFESMAWQEIKRRIDKAAKTKYTPVTALMMDGYRNEKPQVVTIIRPVIGSDDRVWITKADKKRETCNIRSLIDMSCKDEYMVIWTKISELNVKIKELNGEIAKLKRAAMPEPIVKESA
jgi:hypothetical protein